VPQPVGWLRRTAWAMAAALILVLGLDFALSSGRMAPGPAMAPAVAPAASTPQAEQEALRAMEMEDHTRSPEPPPASMFGLAVPHATPTTAAEQPPGPEEIPPPSAPAFPLPTLRIIEFLLLLGAIGLLALDRWRSQHPR
ncbi:MAG: hypothetical protein NZ572_01695, partial [Thermoflexus sp.]|nr:hypothetical protein [Thermoflexus sp.]